MHKSTISLRLKFDRPDFVTCTFKYHIKKENCLVLNSHMEGAGKTGENNTGLTSPYIQYVVCEWNICQFSNGLRIHTISFNEKDLLEQIIEVKLLWIKKLYEWCRYKNKVECLPFDLNQMSTEISFWRKQHFLRN